MLRRGTSISRLSAWGILLFLVLSVSEIALYPLHDLYESRERQLQADERTFQKMTELISRKAVYKEALAVLNDRSKVKSTHVEAASISQGQAALQTLVKSQIQNEGARLLSLRNLPTTHGDLFQGVSVIVEAELSLEALASFLEQIEYSALTLKVTELHLRARQTTNTAVRHVHQKHDLRFRATIAASVKLAGEL